MKIAVYLNCGTGFAEPEEADKTICCDGAFDSMPVRPDYFVGDGDSASAFPDDIPVPVTTRTRISPTANPPYISRATSGRRN